MSDDGNIVTRDKVEMYLALTAEARIKATPITNNDEDERRLNSMLRMCDDYQHDARLGQTVWLSGYLLMVTEASGIFQRATNLPSLWFNGSSGHGTLKRWRY